MSDWCEELQIALTVNGQAVSVTVPVRETLADTLRDRLQLTGTHLGCEQGVCGSCTVFLDGGAVRACTTLAVQADDRPVWTVEGLSPSTGLSSLQELLSSEHGLQCGFCTAGIVVSATELVAAAEQRVTDEEVREALSGNLCRCTGYDSIVRAVVAASQEAVELPVGLELTPAAASTGTVTGVPESVHASAIDRPEPTASRDPDRVAVAVDIAVGALGLLVGVVLRRRRRG